MPKSRNRGRRRKGLAGKLRRLRARLTPEQMKKRAESMKVKSSWRAEMEKLMSQSFGNSNAVGQYAVKNIRRQRNINWAMAVVVVVLATKVFGLW